MTPSTRRLATILTLSASLAAAAPELVPGFEAVTFASRAYDYIVIGGGTAGLAVAARLSEDAGVTVGVLEAGISGEGDDIIDQPGKFGANIGTIYDWNFTVAAVPEFGIPAVNWPRGKVLGGSSALNFMVWDRPAEIEIDAWEKLGNPGWNWENLLPYMKKSETYDALSDETAAAYNLDEAGGVNANYYGTDGPIHISYPDYVAQQQQLWLPAFQDQEVPLNSNPLSGHNLHANISPSNVRADNSSRSYSAPAYYFPNSYRPNLSVLTSARATRLIFDDNKDNGTLRVKCIEFQHGGKTYTVEVLKEAILSAGTVQTPQLLELSGIGRKDILEAVGVKVKLELPGVGENMQDHTYSAASWELKPDVVTLDSLRNDPEFAAQQEELWATPNGSPSILDEAVGSITYLTLHELSPDNAESLYADVVAWVEERKDSSYYEQWKIQLEFLSTQNSSVGQIELIGVDGFFTGGEVPEAGKVYTTLLAANQHPFGRGTIHINSSDPLAYPVILANYFSNPFDTALQTAGTKYLRTIAESPSYQSFIIQETLPGKDVTTDEQWEAYWKTHFTTEYHPIGTASMLPREKGGVVDADLKVYGTSNLRVVDASIIPLHISAHVQAVIYAIAEKAADIIKAC